MYRGYQFRLYPNKEQQRKILMNISYARFLYNKMLEDSIAYYKETGKALHRTPAYYKKQFPWLREADSLCLNNSHQQLRSAFQNFFEKRTRYPKFKSRHHSKWCYTTNSLKNSIRIENHRIQLPKIGWVKVRDHRPPIGILKKVTVSYTRSGKYFVSCEYEAPDTKADPVPVEKAIGLDYSSPHLYVDSNGNIPSYPCCFRQSEKKLAREQRKLSHMKKFSNNWFKQKRKVSRIHEHISNQRLDFLHKLSAQIANEYDLVGIETLNMGNMSRSLHLGKSTMDNGFGMFSRFLEYKLKDRGKQLVKVPWNYASTKTCHICGNKKPMKLSDQIYVCPICGQISDRDINAAINIRSKSLELAAL